MLSYLTSFGANSDFQKNRLIATARNLQAPEEHVLKKILKTFHGEDQETRAQIAYATIVKKILTSDSNQNWIYLLKNLIILDRVLHECCFVEEIAELQLPSIDNYIETNSRYSNLRTPEILKNYWKLIKKYAKILSSKNHILYYPRSQRADFLTTLQPYQVLMQNQPIENLFELCFNFIRSFSSREKSTVSNSGVRNQVQKSKLIQSIFLHMMYKFMSYYSSEMLCINRLTFFLVKDEAMDFVDLQHVRKMKEQLVRFKNNSLGIIEFLEKHKDIRGFEVINYRDLDPMPGNNLINVIDKYIHERSNFDENTKNVHEYISGSGVNVPISVRLKQQFAEEIAIKVHPRKKIEVSRQKKQMNQAFNNWISSFSEDFPQKQFMTHDLRMRLNNQKGSQNIQDEPVILYDERVTCVIPDASIFPQNLHFWHPKSITLNQNFTNIYSKLYPCWNFQ